jgi:hypothetical protein
LNVLHLRLNFPRLRLCRMAQLSLLVVVLNAFAFAALRQAGGYSLAGLGDSYDEHSPDEDSSICLPVDLKYVVDLVRPRNDRRV